MRKDEAWVAHAHRDSAADHDLQDQSEIVLLQQGVLFLSELREVKARAVEDAEADLQKRPDLDRTFGYAKEEWFWLSGVTAILGGVAGLGSSAAGGGTIAVSVMSIAGGAAAIGVGWNRIHTKVKGKEKALLSQRALTKAIDTLEGQRRTTEEELRKAHGSPRAMSCARRRSPSFRARGRCRRRGVVRAKIMSMQADPHGDTRGLATSALLVVVMQLADVACPEEETFVGRRRNVQPLAPGERVEAWTGVVGIEVLHESADQQSTRLHDGLLRDLPEQVADRGPVRREVEVEARGTGPVDEGRVEFGVRSGRAQAGPFDEESLPRLDQCRPVLVGAAVPHRMPPSHGPFSAVHDEIGHLNGRVAGSRPTVLGGPRLNGTGRAC
ncbi:hypothetical protein ACFWN2_03815 [Lentzea sp. NPDC058436]|uniref:hypothetical protein n=1 Tax=Lentzea sp. NPDC058436 TaxID=3346499 RepID=UPI00364849C2